MELTKASIISGNVTIDGFRLDGNYIASQPIPNYLIWEFRGHDEQTTINAGFSNFTGFDVELVSIMGGRAKTFSGVVTLQTFQVTYTVSETNSTYPDNLVFFSDFDQPKLPFAFPQGIIIPNQSKVYLVFSANLAFIRVTTVPRLSTLVGAIVHLP